MSGRVAPSAPASRPGAEARRRSRLPVSELIGVAVQGLRSRKLRAALSALGIAIGIGAMVAVVGVSSSAQANLLAEIDALGTNLLTVTPGPGIGGASGALPPTALSMVSSVEHVTGAAGVYDTSAEVFRSPYVPTAETGGLSVVAASGDLPRVMGASMISGHFLTTAEDRLPEVVLGSAAAQDLQIYGLDDRAILDIGNTSFTVVGTMGNTTLDPTLDDDVFIGLPVAAHDFKAKAHAATIYVRSDQNTVTAVSDLLAPTADPENPTEVTIGRPSDALEARAAVKGQFTTLLLGLGAVALLVGAIGIANIMVISVLERRGEIGLRRALGATRGHITLQFLCESALLAAIGGVLGLLFGAGATAVYASTRHEPFVVPLYALVAAPTAGFLIGAVAGLYPATKAARLSPTEALRA